MRSLAIPWADVLTDVTPEKMVTDPRAVLFRYIAAQFNRRICDAFAAIEDIRLENGLGGTCVNAASATAATICHREVAFQIEVRQNAAQKEPGPCLLIDDAGVF